ncbi:MAG: 16S rRNA (cytosine(1402)-N(4))-methyltransferase RsmH [Candidatus Eisenbacteria bacterium]|uniref:Ribosomal RNA small subunit methyltransferase H n=1 Tax=Eiseniibacteriota bacterium TaxID=2212470 RepID=A0A933SJ54_UNCEI|nr:16S rRNA (cytosine(1402)-N(4))-methyltransferase RsmH [Candidatus Eisenbacteria bacterium]
MTAPDDPRPEHRRRPRYRGTHPRRFEEKYKELSPEQYPEIVPHVLGKGRTPAGQHVPILVDEVLHHLAPARGERAVDATLGWGGHARRLLECIVPGGTLLALDADPIELPRTEERLRKAGFGEDALVVRRSNFAGLRAALAAQGWSDGADLVLADLGVSSMQIDNPARGFTFGADGPLDMRMNPNRGLSAADWLARTSLASLEGVLRDNADEPHAAAIAEALHGARAEFRTTAALAERVRAAVTGLAKEDDVDSSVRRVFQALRIEVNDEFGALDALLRDLPACVRPGGRVAILTFHSGEDRRVKKAFAAGEREGLWARVAPEVVRPSARERHDNPRSKPAKLRWAVRG